MDEYDSRDDIFTMQKKFREVNESLESVDTQIVVEAADSLWMETHGNGYLIDFSNQKDNSSCVPDSDELDEFSSDFLDVSLFSFVLLFS